MPAGRRWVWVLVLGIVVEGAGLGWLLVRSRWEEEAAATPVARGRAVAERMGCFGCHGPGGEKGSANPGAKGDEVPTWTGGTWMMYNDAPGDVQAWILDGHPPGRKPDPQALVAMPAYRGRLNRRQTADLVAYVLTVSSFGAIDNPKAADGRDAAVTLGCFGCHGPEGRGLTLDPGSFKGYVPPWDGPDYPDLVRSGAELRQWIRNGRSDRFAANPAARHFLDTEAVKMPAYGPRVTDAQLDALEAYIGWV